MTPQRIGLISSAVPFIFGGGRFIVDWLEEKLRESGHSVETIYIPTTDDPDSIIEQLAAFRMMDLDEHFDLVITFRPPSHMVKHRRKVCWFIHHIRVFYDLWDSEYCGLFPIPRRRGRSVIPSGGPILPRCPMRIACSPTVGSSRNACDCITVSRARCFIRRSCSRKHSVPKPMATRLSASAGWKAINANTS